MLRTRLIHSCAGGQHMSICENIGLFLQQDVCRVGVTSINVAIKQLFAHCVGLGFRWRTIAGCPQSSNLGSTIKDIYGLPVPRLTNELDDNDREMIKAIRASFRRNSRRCRFDWNIREQTRARRGRVIILVLAGWV